MKLILKQDVSNLGKVGDQVVVKAGFGRNYLLPNGIALRATKDNLDLFERKRTEFEKEAQEVLDKAKERAEKLAGQEIKIPANVGEGGKLFGSIGPRDIAEAVKASGLNLEKREVSMPEGPIRVIGEYEINVILNGSITAKIKVNVVEERA